MCRKRKAATLAGLLFFALLLGIVLGCSGGAPGEWASMQEDLAGRDVYYVAIQALAVGKEETVAGDEAEAFSDAFLDATFDSDNREHFGPTPDIVLTFCYSDRVPVRITQWPDDRFEMTAEGEQFLVSSPELTRLLRSGGFDHQQ